MSDYLTEYAPLIDGIAAEYARKFKKYGVERADVAQEMAYWMLRHPKKLDEWFAEDHGEKMLARTLRNEASRYGQEMKAQALGYSYDDLQFYGKGEVRVLLDAVFSEEAWHEPPVSEDGGRSRRDPATGGGWIATLADVAKAFTQLAAEDQALLRAFHQEGRTNKLMAEMAGVSEQASSKQHDRAIGRLHKILGGDRPRSTHEDPECECGQYVGTRKALTNAAARAVTQANYDED